MTQVPEQNSDSLRRITSILPVQRRVLLLSNPGLGGVDPFNRPSALAELIGRLDGSAVQSISTGLSGHGLRRWWREMHDAVHDAGTVQVVVLSDRHLWTRIVPTLVLARYMGRAIAVHIEVNLEARLSEGERFLLVKLLGLADRISVGATTDCGWLPAAIRTSVVRLRSAAHVESVPARVIGKMQPKALCFVQPDQTGTVASMVRAIELVKQKYPRAELVLATIGTGTIGSVCENAARSGVTCASVSTLAEIKALLGDVDVLIDLSLERASLPLQYALAGGLPVIAVRLKADPCLTDTNAFLLETDDFVAVADTLTAMVERPDAVEAISRAASADHSWGAESLKRQWMTHFEKLRSPRM
ncbi:hypothetical protein KQH82_10715 [bacterium]|nr:hypothetical protein [bacterium]